MVAGLYLLVDCTCLCALCRRLDTTHKGLLLPAPCLYASGKVQNENDIYHQRHRKSESVAVARLENLCKDNASKTVPKCGVTYIS